MISAFLLLLVSFCKAEVLPVYNCKNNDDCDGKFEEESVGRVRDSVCSFVEGHNLILRMCVPTSACGTSQIIDYKDKEISVDVECPDNSGLIMLAIVGGSFCFCIVIWASLFILAKR